MYVAFINHDWCSIFYQFSLLNLFELLHTASEVSAEDIFHPSTPTDFVPVKHHIEGFSSLWLPLTEIVKVWLLINKQFVAGTWERKIDESVVIDGNTHKVSNKLKINVRFERQTIKVVEAHVFVVCKHLMLLFENFCDHETKVFSTHTTFIYAWLTSKSDRDWHFKWVVAINFLKVHNLLQRVFKDILSGNFKSKFVGSSKSFLSHFWIPESTHQEEVLIKLPVHLIVALQQDGLGMIREKPMVRAGVEYISVCYFDTVSHLDFRFVCPLIHQPSKF